MTSVSAASKRGQRGSLNASCASILIWSWLVLVLLRLGAGADNISLLGAILKLMPLDQYVEQPAAIMRRVPADEAANFPVPIYDAFQTTLDAASKAAEGKAIQMELVERFAFYERAKKCFAVVQTGEKRQYGNIIIKKGVIRADE